MAHSSLATVHVEPDGGNYTRGRNTSIQKITVHHMAGVMSSEACGQIFARPGRGGSSNYGIGNDGDIAWYVDEGDTSWCDSNWDSNCKSVTIETSNCATGGDWPVSDAALDSLIRLCADIAKRNGLGTLIPGTNLTWHSMYAATTCPGDYLRTRMQLIADKANEINGGSPAPAPTPAGDFKVGDIVTLRAWVDYNGTPLIQTRDYYFISELNGNRAVLRADSMTGVVYCAANTDNLTKAGEIPTPTPAPTPSDDFKVGDVVVPTRLVDYNGTPLVQYDPNYTISELNGNRAVLTARGQIWAAMNTADIRRA